MLYSLKQWTVFYSLLFVIAIGCKNQPKVVPEKVPDTLPVKVITTDNLSSFKETGANWKVVADVTSDYNKEGDMQEVPGKGVLLNLPTSESKENIFSLLEHGDIELELDFLMPKGSNAGVYFQGRYEVQLFDSWLVENPQHSDCGGIYQRWDEAKPEGEKGYEGHPPVVNASKAPGLWQHYKISFSAPKFDAQGNKVANARFNHVYHNGFLIHKNVELNGPTRAAAFEDEQLLGPLMIQGDHGPTAIKNISYKTYSLDTLALENLTYEVFEGDWDVLPDLFGITPVKTGETKVLDVSGVSERKEKYGVVFNGKLNVPVSGEYLFETIIDDGGNLYIDEKLVVHNDGDPGEGTERGLVNLTEGVHDFKMTYYQNVWGANLSVNYEGPGIHKQPLAALKRKAISSKRKRQRMVVNDMQRPEMIRSFAEYDEAPNKTHVISVGDPKGVHYTYNLYNGALLKAWRGVYADVTEMWVGRGHSQLLKPGNAAIETTDGQPISTLKEGQSWPTKPTGDFKVTGYDVNEAGNPSFNYTLGDVSVVDKVLSTTGKPFLTRTIAAQSNETKQDLWFRIAEGEKITLVSNGLYRIGGQYYIQIEEKNKEQVSVRNGNELVIPLLRNNQTETLQYTIIW